MNSEAEMRQVILHAAEKLDAVKLRTVSCEGNHYGKQSYHMPNDVSLAIAYAEGILRLLASYLKVDPADRAHVTPEPGWIGQKGNGHPPAPPPVKVQPGGRPRERVERNAAVAAAIEAGEKRKDVAARFQISERRVAQIVEAAQATRAGATR